MRWLRDNWIDALIFAVFTITVVGIVLFLTGVNPFGGGRTPVGSGVKEQQTEPQQPSQPAHRSAADEGAKRVTVVPLLPEPPAAEAGPGQAGEPQAQDPQQSSEDLPKSSPPATVPARPNPAERSNAPAGSETGVFRVSVGAFGNPVNALSLAQKLEAQGYAVRLEPVGRVTRVAVGPFTRKSAALEAARKLSAYEPQVYRGDSPEPKQHYLQVGAFKQLASARATVRSLRERGIGPVVLWYQKPWIKVWVGPVEPQVLPELKRKLTDAGFEVVEVR